MAQDHRARAASALIVGRAQQASTLGRDPKHIEIVTTDPQPVDTLTIGAFPKKQPGVTPREHPREGVLVRSNQLPEWMRHLGIESVADTKVVTVTIDAYLRDLIGT